MEISKAEFIDWHSQPVTEQILETLSEIREGHLEHLRSAARNGEISTAAFHEGVIEGIDLLLAIEYGDVEDE